jgi:cyclic beta-1,2-glucan synthetase
VGAQRLLPGGGAYGFRDQIQDTMALAASSPEITRAHLLRAAARQFPEGDVQHWWHPRPGAASARASRTTVLWLPYATAHYVETTGDAAILNEAVPYLEGPALKPGEMESYFEPRVSSRTATSSSTARRRSRPPARRARTTCR